MGIEEGQFKLIYSKPNVKRRGDSERPEAHRGVNTNTSGGKNKKQGRPHSANTNQEIKVGKLGFVQIKENTSKGTKSKSEISIKYI